MDSLSMQTNPTSNPAEADKNVIVRLAEHASEHQDWTEAARLWRRAAGLTRDANCYLRAAEAHDRFGQTETASLIRLAALRRSHKTAPSLRESAS
jgi:uncharacterized protein HemY